MIKTMTPFTAICVLYWNKISSGINIYLSQCLPQPVGMQAIVKFYYGIILCLTCKRLCRWLVAIMISDNF